jgi:hypothetical protein
MSRGGALLVGKVIKMGPEDAVRGYRSLALRVDRLLPGAVDSYGERAIPTGRRPAPAEIVRAAGRLADALPSAELRPDRERFLLGQLVAVEWTARRLAGQAVPYADEVAAVYQARIDLGPEDAYRRVHRELDDLLGGPGPLADRLHAHRGRDEIPPELLEPAVLALSAALRERTRAVVPLPAAEHVEYRVVDDAPWSALHQYLGGFRSRITVNAGARLRRAQLVQLVAHEAYPGHHTERCRREAGLVTMGWDEHRIVLACSPQSLVAEGAADLGLHAVVGPGWGRFAADVLADVGLAFDGELAERTGAATGVLARARQDAALLLHHRRVPVDEVLAYLRRWTLVDDARARQVLRFLRHPLWRTYTTTYVEGGPLLRRWWERDPRPERFVRLLDEPLTPAAVRAELVDGAAAERNEPDELPTGPATDGVQGAMSGSPLCEFSVPAHELAPGCC